MRGAAALVDVEAIGLVRNGEHLGAECAEHAGGDGRGRAVRAVERDAITLEREVRGRDERADVAVAPLDVVDGAADLLACCQRHLGLAVDVVLDLLQNLGAHLVAAGIDELDTVIVIGVVARGDHDAAAEVAVAHHIAHRGVVVTRSTYASAPLETRPATSAFSYM